MLLNVLFILFSTSFGSVYSGNPIATTPYGQVEGFIAATFSGKNFSAFEGIPYAKPPIRKLRFRDPKPTRPWRGVWKANTVFQCMQLSKTVIVNGTYLIIGDEDCLYLNIYSPNVTRSGMDVIVLIHGGMFTYNYGAMWGPKIILNNDVVLVTLNYRLGPLGFLTTGDDYVPGNMGLKDQIQALKWVKENIKFFGGNPDSITLAGENAGATSVHLFYLSTLTKGLFHRGLALSGTALNPWAISKDVIKNSKELAVLVGCENTNNIEMAECLRRRPGRQIVQNVQNFLKIAHIPYAPFGVVIDKWSKSPVVCENPYVMLKKKKIQQLPIIFSNTENDALYHAADFLLTPDYNKELETKWNDLMPLILDYDSITTEDDKNLTSKNVQDYYLKNEGCEKDKGKDKGNDKQKAKSGVMFPTIAKMMDDRLYKETMQLTLNMHAAATTAPVYYYYFSYKKPHSRANINIQDEENMQIVDDAGPSQGDDMKYVFGNDQVTDKEEVGMSKTLVNMWTSYAQTGTPVLTKGCWEKINPEDDKIKGVHVKTVADITTSVFENLGNKEFWESLPLRENVKLFTPKDEL